MPSQHLAFVFPGQGSQKIGMLADLANEYPIVIKTFAEASQVLGYDDINLTERTQPLLLTASVAVWRVWQEKNGTQPALMAGHSLGEWSALVCAGVVAFSDAVKLVQQRGKFMQEAVPAGQGAMAAIIGLSDALIIKACKQTEQGEVVAAVNFNSPGQVVIAGTAAAVERASVLCKEAGAKRALPLPVSAPFHTSLMRPAADRLTAQIAATPFAIPQIPIVHNVTAQTESDPQKIKTLMIEQIYSAVRWVDCVNTLSKNKITITVECGPGKVLSGLNKRINAELTTFSIEKPEEVIHVLACAQ
jgi:[acyl-carrier-protein] S-malonyltransferase